MLIFLERTFKSIAMDTDFLTDIVYHSVIGYVRQTFHSIYCLVYTVVRIEGYLHK